ncbi:hypothetical protein EVAR_59806_1 [Eumeta japonica]|uniref:Uncharacterized protein n=1 Tax=Eumeta variegata TaxID=151549 RepID=A0A4C1YFL0_EUMVA|nr:hypothetical protein EVAR_59806_1 [Eumeta japonica]
MRLLIIELLRSSHPHREGYDRWRLEQRHVRGSPPELSHPRFIRRQSLIDRRPAASHYRPRRRKKRNPTRYFVRTVLFIRIIL